MRVVLLSAAFLAVAAAGGCQPPTAAAPARQEFKLFDLTASEGYSALMPGTPQIRSGGTQFNPTTVYSAVNPGVRYETHSAKVLQLGGFGGEPKPADVTKMLHESRDRYLKEVSGTIVSTSATTLNGLPGVMFTATLKEPESWVLKGRIFYQDWRVYGAVVIGERAEVNGADAGKFFDSYTIAIKPRKK